MLAHTLMPIHPQQSHATGCAQITQLETVPCLQGHSGPCRLDEISSLTC